MSETIAASNTRRRISYRIANAFSFTKPLVVRLFAAEARAAEAWASGAHHRLFLAQWGLRPMPEYFTHKIDLFWRWRAKRNSYWVERGVFSGLAISPGARVLELCCGDGFNSYFFYSAIAGRVLAVDFDHGAIRYAKSKYKTDNLDFRVADIRTQMPEGDFDNVVWDAAIEHFTEVEIAEIMANIKKRLSRNGVLSGYTLVEKTEETRRFEHHEIEFKSKDDLARFLTPHFKNVTVFETLSPERHNLYFWASDGTIPFRHDWPHVQSTDAISAQ
jgi:SAM-dependent methyltransferase